MVRITVYSTFKGITDSVENYNDKTGLWCQKAGTTGPCSNMLKKLLKMVIGIKNIHKNLFFMLRNFRACWYEKLKF
jgi:hypothetical protein